MCARGRLISSEPWTGTHAHAHARRHYGAYVNTLGVFIIVFISRHARARRENLKAVSFSDGGDRFEGNGRRRRRPANVPAMAVRPKTRLTRRRRRRHFRRAPVRLRHPLTVTTSRPFAARISCSAYVARFGPVRL